MIFVTHRKRPGESEAQTRQPAFPAPLPNPASSLDVPAERKL